MSLSINIQKITRARARRISNYFSTVDVTADTEHDGWFADNEVSLFLEGPGHEDAAARIAALINEQIVRRDAKAVPDCADFEDDTDEQLLEEQAQEDRRQAHNDELGPRAPQFPREHEEAMERLVERDDEVPF